MYLVHEFFPLEKSEDQRLEIDCEEEQKPLAFIWKRVENDSGQKSDTQEYEREKRIDGVARMHV